MSDLFNWMFPPFVPWYVSGIFWATHGTALLMLVAWLLWIFWRVNR